MGKANLFENQNIAKLNAAQKNANKCARKPKNIYKKIDTKISDNHELVAKICPKLFANITEKFLG